MNEIKNSKQSIFQINEMYTWNSAKVSNLFIKLYIFVSISSPLDFALYFRYLLNRISRVWIDVKPAEMKPWRKEHQTWVPLVQILPLTLLLQGSWIVSW